jgi:hypothetical protein
MTAVIVATSSSHGFPPHRSDFVAFHQQLHHRGPTTSHSNPFEAFARHHHSGTNSPSEVASWRHSKPVVQAPRSTRTPSPTPKYRPSGRSHSRTPSISTSHTSWRSEIHSLTPNPDGKFLSFPHCDLPLRGITAYSGYHPPRPSSQFVYSIQELLRLSASPLVGITQESQAVVDDLVAHHVWRRGPQSRPSRVGNGRRSCDIPKSSDDSEHSD